MLFSPAISFITFGKLGLYSSAYYFQLLSCIIGLAFLVKRNSLIKLNEVTVILLFYLLYIIIWSFNNGYFEEKGIINTTNAKNFSILFILIIISVTDFSDLFILASIKIIKVTIIAAFIVSLIQVIYPSFMDANYIWAKGELGDTLTGDLYKDRRPSIFGFIDTNEVGLSFLPLLSILIGYLIATNSRYLLFFVIIGGVTAFLTNTRYIMIGYLLILMQFFLAKKSNFKSIIKYLSISILLSIILYFLLRIIGYNLNDWYANRLLSEGSLKETSRYFAWVNFVRFFPEQPLFGTGVHMTREIQVASNEAGSSQIHVGYLSHLVSYGVFGSLLLFGFWFLLAKRLFQKSRQTMFYGSFFAILVFLWANATLVKYSMFYYGIIFSLVFDKYFYSKYLIQKEKANRIKISKQNEST